MKKRKDKLGIIVHKRQDLGKQAFPVFVDMAHRQLEKSPPPGIHTQAKNYNVSIPVDLLRVGDVFPPRLINTIESITLVYEKRS